MVIVSLSDEENFNVTRPKPQFTNIWNQLSLSANRTNIDKDVALIWGD